GASTGLAPRRRRLAIDLTQSLSACLSKPRAACPGFSLWAKSEKAEYSFGHVSDFAHLRRTRRVESRDTFRERVQPGDQPRMAGTPSPVEAQILITERAGEGDLSDMRRAVEGRGIGFEAAQRPFHLAGLMRHPFRFVAVGGAPAS